MRSFIICIFALYLSGCATSESTQSTKVDRTPTPYELRGPGVVLENPVSARIFRNCFIMPDWLNE